MARTADGRGVRVVLAGRVDAGQEGADESPARWLKRLDGEVRERAGEWVESRRLDVDGRGRPLLALRLHPAAEEVQVVAAGERRVVLGATTASVGPGYHLWLCDLVHALGDALGIDWTPADLTGGVGDPTGYFETGDTSGVAPRFLAWLRHGAAEALEARAQGHQGRVSLALRFGHTFQRPGALLTALGPRDEAWLKRVRDEPLAGVDVFPWWRPGLDAAALLGRARALLWTEMVWRPPLLEDERARLRKVARLLEAAWRQDPALDYPWREWQEVLGYLGVGGTLAETVRARAQAAPPGVPLGYRRGDVQVTLEEGWSVRIDGSFAEERLADGSWLGRDHRRSVRLVPLEGGAPLEAPEAAPALPPELRPEHPPAPPRALEHRGARVHSRASLHPDGRLTALCEAGPAGGQALCVIRFEDPDDVDWALSTWRSVDYTAAA